MTYDKNKKIAELKYCTTSLLHTPITTHISKLLQLPLRVQRKYLDACDKEEFEISHYIRTNCHFPIALETVASIEKNGPMETDDEFATRCAYNISNLLNAYIIPVFLLRVLTEPDDGVSGLSPRWSRAISITCRLDSIYNESTGHNFDVLKLIFHKKLSSNSECNEFFFVASEYIRQVVLSPAHRVGRASFYIILSHEVVLNATSSLYSLSHSALKSIAQSLQLLPIYRLLLENSTEDYGITRAPYNLGAVCALKSSLETRKNTTRPILKQQCTCWIYVHGKKAKLLPDDAFYIAPTNVKMDMLSLYEVDPSRMGNAERPRYIFPILCIEREALQHLGALKPNLRARGINIDSDNVGGSKCAIIDLQPNPLATYSCTPETVASYLQLLTVSCRSLLGSNYRIMACASILQRMDTSQQDYRVFHILNIGTLPKRCAEAFLCDESKILIYDEARKNLNRGDSLSPIQQDSTQTLTSTITCLLSEACERHPTSGLTGILEYLHVRSPNLEHFLKEHKMKLVLVIQERNKKRHAVRERHGGSNIAYRITETLPAASVKSPTVSTSDSCKTQMLIPPIPLADLSLPSVFTPTETSTPLTANKPEILAGNTTNTTSLHTNDAMLSETTSKLTHTSSRCNDETFDAQDTELTSHEVADKPSIDSMLNLTDSELNLQKHPTLKKIDKVVRRILSKTALLYISFLVLSVSLYIFVIRSTFETQHLLQYDMFFICSMLGAAALFFTLAHVACYHVTCKILEKLMKSVENSPAYIALEASTNGSNADDEKQKDTVETAARDLSTNLEETYDIIPLKFVLPRGSSCVKMV